jgi:orotate phosphoribosyltransferase
MNSMDRQLLAADVDRACRLQGQFQLRSGHISNEYFDKYLFESDPALLAEIAEAMVALVPRGIDALAGLELGGIPLVTMLAQRTGLPALFVRKQAKDYGTCRLADGGDIAGRRLLVVEDVVTSGGQVVISAGDLRQAGAEVADVVCVIDREAGGPEALAEAGLRLHALFTISELHAAAG